MDKYDLAKQCISDLTKRVEALEDSQSRQLHIKLPSPELHLSGSIHKVG